MELRIQGAYYSERFGLERATLYAYTSNGLPGIDIIGMGQHAKDIREKFMFLSKERKLKIPLKRYIIGLEKNEEYEFNIKEPKDLLWLEFPTLLLFWSLAQVIRLCSPNNCIASGRVSVTGIITLPPLINLINHQCKSDCYSLLTVIDNKDFINQSYQQKFIPAQNLLENINDIQWRTKVPSILKSKRLKVI